MILLFVLLGSAVGGVCRHLLSAKVGALVGESFPWGTFLANTLGSFLLGLVFGFHGEQASSSAAFSAFAAIGFCGSLTTFSTFSLQTLTLVSQQKWKHVAGKIFGSLVVCMFLAFAGYELGKVLTG